jgi:hypothetical protein
VLTCFRCFTPLRVLVAEFTLPGVGRTLEPRTITKIWNGVNASILHKHPNILGWLRVIEPHKDGVLHLHVLFVTRGNTVRPAYPSELKRGQKCPRSLNNAGRELRKAIKRYAVLAGFGARCTIGPLKETPLCLAKYFAKFFARSQRWKYKHLRGVRCFGESAALKKEILRLCSGIVIGKRARNGLKRKQTAQAGVIQKRYDWLLCPRSHQVCPNPTLCGLSCKRSRIRLTFAGKLKHP